MLFSFISKYHIFERNLNNELIWFYWAHAHKAGARAEESEVVCEGESRRKIMCSLYNEYQKSV